MLAANQIARLKNWPIFYSTPTIFVGWHASAD